MTKHPELFAALAAPFERGQVRQKTETSKATGRSWTCDYITARTAMNRLDEVLGPENWWDEYTPLTDSVICRLSIRLPDGLVVTKSDAGGCAGMADAGDDDKSGFSDAFKRAAVKFGVARYLYKDGVASFAPRAAAPPVPKPPGSEDCQGRGGRVVYGQSSARANGRPKSGEDLHYYAGECTIDPMLRGWIGANFAPLGYPAKIVDWSPAHVTEAWPTIREHLETVRTRSRVKASA